MNTRNSSAQAVMIGVLSSKSDSLRNLVARATEPHSFEARVQDDPYQKCQFAASALDREQSPKYRNTCSGSRTVQGCTVCHSSKRHPFTRATQGLKAS